MIRWITQGRVFSEHINLWEEFPVLTLIEDKMLFIPAEKDYTKELEIPQFYRLFPKLVPETLKPIKVEITEIEDGYIIRRIKDEKCKKKGS